MMVCNDHFKNHKLCPVITNNINVTGTIREWIEILATKEALLKQNSQLRTEFKEVFEPIPHVNELPSDVFAAIHLKNAEKTIKSHSYPSPCKYKEAWSILIQQHLDAGRIRPSSSPCTSSVATALAFSWLKPQLSRNWSRADGPGSAAAWASWSRDQAGILSIINHSRLAHSKQIKLALFCTCYSNSSRIYCKWT